MRDAAKIDRQRRRQTGPLLKIMLLGLLLGLVPFSLRPAAGQSTVVGGPCRYDIHPGFAEIVSVEPVTVAGETMASIRFVFHPDQPLPNTWVRLADQPQQLKMVNGTDPSIPFMEKYGLELGRFLKCHLKTITKGTCTPAIFDFPEVDRTDYLP